MAQSLPVSRDFIEFAEKTHAVNLEVSLGDLLKYASILEQAVALRDPGIAAGWFVYSPGYCIIVGYGPGEAIHEIASGSRAGEAAIAPSARSTESRR